MSSRNKARGIESRPTHSSQRSLISVREGDGVSVPITINPVIGVGGETYGALNVNFDKLPIPSRRYTADICSVFDGSNVARLVFGQKKICGEELRSIIVINSTRKSLKEFVHSISNINPSLKDISKTLAIEKESTIKAITEPDQALSLTANIISIAISGYDTVLDFYNVSPTSMKSAGSSGNIGIDPIVRVELNTSIFIGLFDSITNCLTDTTAVKGE